MLTASGRRTTGVVAAALLMTVVHASASMGDAPWRPHGGPPLTAYAAMAFDASDGKVVLFGGARSGLSGPPSDDTWTWDGVGWAQERPPVKPPARIRAGMVFDSARNRIVLFGGSDATGVALDDTWTWDGSTWAEQHPATRPPATSQAVMAYHAPTSTVVLVGTTPGTGDATQTWTWDGVNWTQQHPPASPPPRHGPALAYDEVRQTTVLFGGYGTKAGPPFADTWTWNGSTWEERHPRVHPPTRQDSMMAFDAGTGKVVLFGGAGFDGRSSAGSRDDTWTWDGLNWSEQRGRGGPKARASGAISIDPQRRTVVLFGGFGELGLDDTWVWDGRKWSEPVPVPTGPRAFSAMAYDATAQAMVMFGGFQRAGAQAGDLGDTWTWDGQRWSRRDPSKSPPARGYSAMAFDPRAKRVVLFGGLARSGYLGDTWTWDGENWAQQRPAASPPLLAHASMVYDTARARVVLFGGENQSGPRNETWAWDGSTWSQEHPAVSPPPRASASMAFDEALGTAVVFGGYGSTGPLADTWVWDGATWAERVVENGPRARYNAPMAYSSATGRAVLFGGFGRLSHDDLIADTWTWDGSAWRKIDIPSSPPGQSGQVMAYFPPKREVVLIGGELRNFWTWDGRLPAELQPASLRFGGIRPGATSPPRSVNLRNPGQAPITVGSVTLAGADVAQFATGADTCTGATLQPGGSCSVAVTFSPTGRGPRSASLAILEAGSEEPHSAALAGGQSAGLASSL